MGLLSSGGTAIGRLIGIVTLVVAFFVGLVGVVFMSLQGREIKVPQVTGKSFNESEDELASLGLKIKRRADRVSPEPPNTIIEQLPKPGETVKTGQMILVVTSKGGGDANQQIKPPVDEDDSDKIEEMITEKPKKPKANTNSNSAKKKADTARDVTGTDTPPTTGSDNGETGKKESDKKGEGDDKGGKATPQTSNRPTAPKPVENRAKPMNRP